MRPHSPSPDVFLILSLNDQNTTETHDRKFAISTENSICSETKTPLVMADYYTANRKKRNNILVRYARRYSFSYGYYHPHSYTFKYISHYLSKCCANEVLSFYVFYSDSM